MEKICHIIKDSNIQLLQTKGFESGKVLFQYTHFDIWKKYELELELKYFRISFKRIKNQIMLLHARYNTSIVTENSRKIIRIHCGNEKRVFLENQSARIVCIMHLSQPVIVDMAKNEGKSNFYFKYAFKVALFLAYHKKKYVFIF